MSNKQDRAEKWLIKVIGGAAVAVVGGIIFGDGLQIYSFWAYIGGVAILCVGCFLVLWLSFEIGPKKSAKMVAWPAGTLLLLPLIFHKAVLKWALYVVVIAIASMWAMLLLGALALKITGKKELNFGRPGMSLADVFTPKFWRKRQ